MTMNRQVKHHLWTYIDCIEKVDITLTDADRSEDSEHIGKILAACVALLKSLVNPPITVSDSTDETQNSDIKSGESEQK